MEVGEVGLARVCFQYYEKENTKKIIKRLLYTVSVTLPLTLILPHFILLSI